jgi:hypothetical protein
MTSRKDPDRLIYEFLEEGPTELADQVFDAVRASIDQKRQRAVIGLWRVPIMNKVFPISLGAAAVVVALVVGSRLLAPAAAGTVGSASSASPAATAAASPSLSIEPTPSPSASAGPSTFAIYQAEADGSLGIDVTVAPGWGGDQGMGTLEKSDLVGMIVFRDSPRLFVPRDPCRWLSTLPKKPSTTVASYVTALGAQLSRQASAPKDIKIDGYAGKRITLHVPEDLESDGTSGGVFPACDQSHFCSLADPVSYPTDGCARYHQAPGQIDEVSIVNVNGTVVLIFAAYYPETSPGDVAELRAIVDSITFGS